MNNINIPYNIEYITIKVQNKNLVASDECLLAINLSIDDIVSQK